MLGLRYCPGRGEYQGADDSVLSLEGSSSWWGDRGRAALCRPWSSQLFRLLASYFTALCLRFFFYEWVSWWCLLGWLYRCILLTHGECSSTVSSSHWARYKSPGIPSQGVWMLKLSWINSIHSNSFLSTDGHLEPCQVSYSKCLPLGVQLWFLIPMNDSPKEQYDQ